MRTIAIGYIAVNTGTEILSICVSPTLANVILDRESIAIQALYETLGINLAKYWLQEVKSPTEVVKHANENITPSKTDPFCPNK